MFAGLVILGIVRRGAAVAALAAAGVTFAALGLPNNLGLLLGAIVGIAAGYVVDRSGGDQPRERASS
jgi:membrane protease YdiL (CAAX protease family)